MTIPDKKLELSIEFNKLSLGEASLFDTANAASFEWLNQLRKFVIKYSTTWTAAEVNEILIDELAVVAPKVVEAMQAIAVPLANSTPSKTGRAKKRT